MRELDPRMLIEVERSYFCGIGAGSFTKFIPSVTIV